MVNLWHRKYCITVKCFVIWYTLYWTTELGTAASSWVNPLHFKFYHMALHKSQWGAATCTSYICEVEYLASLLVNFQIFDFIFRTKILIKSLKIWEMPNGTTWTAVDSLRRIHFILAWSVGSTHYWHQSSMLNRIVDASGKFSPTQDAVVTSLAEPKMPSASQYCCQLWINTTCCRSLKSWKTERSFSYIIFVDMRRLWYFSPEGLETLFWVQIYM